MGKEKSDSFRKIEGADVGASALEVGFSEIERLHQAKSYIYACG
jgi:hypothetical protein